MPDANHPEAQSNASKSAAMILQIEAPGAASPLQFPAVVRNLAAGIVTLEVKNPWSLLNWETLEGQGGCLRLLSGTGEVTDLRGSVSWAKYFVHDQANGNLNLGLKLDSPDAAAQKLVSECISHTSEDIKSLWDRWDQARQAPPPAAISTRTSLLSVGLLAAATVLQLAGSQGLKLFGWGLWFCGTVVVATQAIHFWQSLKGSQQCEAPAPFQLRRKS